MFRSASNARLVLSFTCLAVAFFGVRAASAIGGDCSQNPNSCDLQEKSTTLRAQIWSGQCASSEWNALPSSAYPIDSSTSTIQLGPRAPVNFLTGACELLRPGGNIDNGISELQKAQTVGLLPSQRNVAELFEGLLHCKKLATIDRSKIPTSAATREQFCVHRSMAKASFGSVSFANMDVRYDTPSPTLNDQIDAMSQCFADYLHGGYDATCAVITAPSPDAVTDAATRMADDVLTRYFGDSQGTTGDQGVPPLKAMLARKIQMADASIRGSTDLFNGLEQKNQLLTASFQSLGSMFCIPKPDDDPSMPCVGPIPNRVGALYGAYEAAVLRTESILSFVDQWVNGLYEFNGKDVRADLKTGLIALTDVLARVEKPVQPNELSLNDKLHFIKRDMALLANSADAENATVRKACSVYFCEMRHRSPMFFRSACDQLDPVAGSKVSEGNKLCAAAPDQTFLAGDAGASAYSVCQAAGFPISTMTAARMSSAEVDACMTTYHK